MNLTKVLVQWYDLNKRDLAWRKTKDPYKIWVSEIIMQQTRIEQGTSYYHNFLAAFPTLNHLANAPADEVMKIWEGLGYYTRARNMHITARYLKEYNNCKFPGSYAELIKLKGIGDYTAAEIASLSFNEPVMAIDGNVMRFMSRYFGIVDETSSAAFKKKIKIIGDEMIDKNNPGRFNQAMIEFGALQCIPRNPGCVSCVVNSSCFAYAKNKVSELPVKKKLRKSRWRYFHYFLLLEDEYMYIKKREKKDIWSGLYDFPLIETKNKTSLKSILTHDEFHTLTGGQNISLVIQPISKKHILSHQIIWATFYIIRMKKASGNTKESYIRVRIKELSRYSLPRLLSKFILLEKVKNTLKIKADNQ